MVSSWTKGGFLFVYRRPKVGYGLIYPYSRYFWYVMVTNPIDDDSLIVDKGREVSLEDAMIEVEKTLDLVESYE